MSPICSRNSVFFFTRLLLQCNFNQELSVRQKKKCRFLDLLTSYNSKNSSYEMSPSSKLVSNNSRTFLKVVITLVFISKLQQEKALQQPAVARAFLMLFFAPLRRRDSTTADLVEGAWGEVAVAMAPKIALRKLARRRVVVAPFPVEV